MTRFGPRLAGNKARVSTATATRSKRAGAERKAADNPWFEGLGRAGLVARGVLYIVVGILAIQLATGDHNEQPDRQGALAAVARQPFGRFLLITLAIGYVGYAAWQLIEAVLDPEDAGDDGKGLLKRVHSAGRALIGFSLAWTATSFALHGRGTKGQTQTDGNQKEQDVTARLFELPLGRWIVIAIGLALIAGGIANGIRAARGKHKKKLDDGPPARLRPALYALGAAGMTGRGLAFVLVGLFVAKAGWEYDPKESVGLDGALQRLAGQPYGPVLLFVVAAGLLAFGLFCLAQARWRKVLEPRR
jgi:hypothetical protein